MSVSLAYKVSRIIQLAYSKIGVKSEESEAANIELAHHNMNLMLGMWSADPDLGIARTVPLAGYTSLDDVVDLPPEYINAIVMNLAVTLTDDFDQKASKQLTESAGNALNAIRIFNIRNISGRIPTNKK